MLEGALSFLPLMVLTLGMIDMSMWLFVRGTIQSAAREAVRFGITYNTSYNGQSCGSQTNCVKKVFTANSMGFINTNNIDQYVTVRYYAYDNLSTPLTAADVGRVLADGTRINAINQTGFLMEVRVTAFPWSFMAPTSYLPNSPLNIHVATSDVLQGLPVGQFDFPQP
jgi:Flp pilus assembly protein TadG